jgi:hypothetical protein
MSYYLVAGSGSGVLALPLCRQYPVPRTPRASRASQLQLHWGALCPLSLRWAAPTPAPRRPPPRARLYIIAFDRRSRRAALQPYLDKSLHPGPPLTCINWEARCVDLRAALEAGCNNCRETRQVIAPWCCKLHSLRNAASRTRHYVFCVRCALALIGIGVAGVWGLEGGSVFVCCYCYWAVLGVGRGWWLGVVLWLWLWLWLWL